MSAPIGMSKKLLNLWIIFFVYLYLFKIFINLLNCLLRLLYFIIFLLNQHGKYFITLSIKIFRLSFYYLFYKSVFFQKNVFSNFFHNCKIHQIENLSFISNLYIFVNMSSLSNPYNFKIHQYKICLLSQIWTRIIDHFCFLILEFRPFVPLSTRIT